MIPLAEFKQQILNVVDMSARMTDMKGMKFGG